MNSASQHTPAPSCCPACGGSNSCGFASAGPHKAGCWCFDVTVEPSTLRRVGSQIGLASCLCPRCLAGIARGPDAPAVAGHDFYHLPDGRVVFTAAYHLRRGHCCGSGCRHCPYPPG